MPTGAMSAVSAVAATFSCILLCLETGRSWKYIVTIFHKFSTKGMRIQMQSTNLLKITHTYVDVFYVTGHFRKSACFDIKVGKFLSLTKIFCISFFQFSNFAFDSIF